MPVVFIRHIGSNLALIEPVGAVDPGYGAGIGVGGGDPGYDHSIWGRPDHGLPGYGHPGNRPPGSWAGHIDNSLPGGAGHPDNRPPTHPPVVAPNQTLVLVRDPVGVWHYATIDASTPPPKPVPVPPPPTGGTPLPPTAAPKA